MKSKENRFENQYENLKRFLLFSLICLLLPFPDLYGKTLNIEAKNTITVVELDEGDEIKYELQSGRIVHIKLISSKSEIIFSTIELPGKGSSNDASVFKMECLLNIDGQELNMIRYVPVQESFYEPYNVNGLRIWFDALKSLNQFYNENHGACLPEKQIRLALHDATLPICPEEITNWCNIPANYPDIELCYRGEDTWLGTYYGTDLHGGLDINMPSNAPLWTPISFDYNYNFNSVNAGHNNNRWRAFKYWDNGDTWIIQTHHHNELLIPEFQPVSKGTKYAYTAGINAGSHTHTHFVFKVKQPEQKEYLIDPWIIFWQILENKKINSQGLKSIIRPLCPSKTGEIIQFNSSDSQHGLNSLTPEYFWSFGDGGFSISQNPTHSYQNPGIYPITLSIFDGVKYSSSTQHITINGSPTSLPEIKVSQEKNISFNIRRFWETDTYNNSHLNIPNTVIFSLPHRSKENILPQTISIRFLNKESFSNNEYPFRIETIYQHGSNWLEFESTAKGEFMNMKLMPKINSLNTQEGEFVALLVIHDNEFTNSPYIIRIVVKFERPSNETITIIDDQDINCIKSNYYWLTNKLNPDLGFSWSKSYGNSFLISSNNPENGFIRYMPKIIEGKYRVALHSPLYDEEILTRHMKGFYVNISSKDGFETKWINPAESIEIGEFNFYSCEGYVEIISEKSKGLIIADAIIFEKINE